MSSAPDFYEYGGMPHTIEAIDGSHIRILAPSRNEHAYVNIYGTHSINVQVNSSTDIS